MHMGRARSPPPVIYATSQRWLRRRRLLVWSTSRLPSGKGDGLRPVKHREQRVQVEPLDGRLVPREPDGGAVLKVRRRQPRAMWGTQRRQ